MKRIIRFAAVIFVSAFLVLLFPMQLRSIAADRVYYISGYKIYVNVNQDGSTDIEERLTYNYRGKFNGALRDVDFSGTKGFAGQKVFVEKNGSLTEWRLNKSNSLDQDGQPGTYNFAIEGGMAHFKIFEPSLNEEKTFVIKYKLLDVVTRFNDVAVFNRKLIDTGWKTRLENIYIRITLPEGALKEDIKVFAHGPLTGESSIIDARNVEFKVPDVSPGTFAETLVVFPPKLVPGSGNVVNKDALPGIMENEQKLADEANKIRENARNQVQDQQERQRQQELELSRLASAVGPFGMIAAILLFLFWFFLIIYIYIKYDRELKHNFEGKYSRELPGTYTPAEMSVLLSFGQVQSRDIMATLMDLVRKKQLELITNKHLKKGFFGSKEITEYVIAARQDAPQAELKLHENYLIEWFIGKIGSGYSVSLDEIKDYVHNRSRALEFKSDYDKWSRLAREEADSNKFFDETSKKGRLIGILSGLAYMASGILIATQLYTPAAYVLLIQGVILLIFSARIKRCTAYGSEQRAMWHAFRNFLKDFSNMEKAVIPSIVIWEHYLVYAISLGVAKEVIKQLPLIFTDNDLSDNRLTFMHGAAYGYFAGFNTMFDNTIHTVEGAITSAVAIANSANSSSSGGGGGFSGGSSGGGGGGGGGGAF